MKRGLALAGLCFVVAILLGVGSSTIGQRVVVQAAVTQAPKFEVDPMWPKPLPNHWVLGQTIGVSVDSRDHVWILHRPATLEVKESYLATNSARCCNPAPPVLEFDQAGTLVGNWGGPGEGHDWPASNHGITVDFKGNVWIGSNGRGTPPGAAPADAGGRGKGKAAPAAPVFGVQQPADESAGAVAGYYHDSFVLKYTQQGKFLMQIGKAGASKGSNDTDNLRGPAQTYVDPKTNELYIADGYGNKRIAVYDADTGKYKRHWGAYGKKPDDTTMPAYSPDAPVAQQFRNPVHCVAVSNDDMVYVCDRVNDRIQIFKKDGTFVKEVFLLRNTRGDGSAWEIAFSKDQAQKYMYVSDGANEQVHIFDRQSMEELTAFGDGGRQPGQFYAVHSIATDSKGNIYTTETYRGQRLQKFVYKGLGPVTSKDMGIVWPKK